MIVIDNSVFVAQCMSDEDDPMATVAMRHAIEQGCVVPRIWWYELRHALLANERSGRMSKQKVSDTLADILKLNIEMDDHHDESLLFGLARQFKLTVYDAAYLEVASRRSLPLATLDRRMREAADAVGIIGLDA